jgi:hypothetical protein
LNESLAWIVGKKMGTLTSRTWGRP